MPALKVPASASSGILTIAEATVASGTPVDVTTHLRRARITDEAGQELDLGTWADPTASQQTAGRKTFDCEWLPSYSDGTDDGLYDVLLPYVGLTCSIVWQPFGSGSSKPKWEFDSYIPANPVGQLGAEYTEPVNTSWGIADETYTAAV